MHTLEPTPTQTCAACGRAVPTHHPLKRGLCGGCRDAQAKGQESGKIDAAIRHLLERDDVLILDTETTGTGKRAEVIEVSVINTKGEALLDTLVKPKVLTMNPFAQRVHKISLDMLADAPTWPSVLPALADLADRRTVLAWNASFDARMLEGSSALWGLPHPSWLFVCAMRLYARKHATRARGLHKAVADEGLTHLFDLHKSHRALGDVKFVLEVLRSTSKNGVFG